MSAAGSSYALGVGASQLGASRMGGQQATLYAAGGLELASSGVHLPDASLELDAPPRELIAHAALEAAQTKLEVMQALAQAKMELVEAKLSSAQESERAQKLEGKVCRGAEKQLAVALRMTDLEVRLA